MAQPFKVAFPPNLDLDGGSIIRVSAIDPTTGAFVSGVSIANLSIQVIDVTGAGPQAFEAGPFMLVPGPNA
jgi:hypothetical protein